MIDGANLGRLVWWEEEEEEEEGEEEGDGDGDGHEMSKIEWKAWNRGRAKE